MLVDCQPFLLSDFARNPTLEAGGGQHLGQVCARPARRDESRAQTVGGRPHERSSPPRVFLERHSAEAGEGGLLHDGFEEAVVTEWAIRLEWAAKASRYARSQP